MTVLPLSLIVLLVVTFEMNFCSHAAAVNFVHA